MKKRNFKNRLGTLFIICVAVIIFFTLKLNKINNGNMNIDVDGSGRVDLYDVVIVANELSSKDTLYDFNGNGQVDLLDTIYVLKRIGASDKISPEIFINGETQSAIEVNTRYTDLGAIWLDDYDAGGNLVGSGSVDSNKVGTYQVEYHIKDSNGNVANQAIRTVAVVDTTNPTFDTIENQTISVNSKAIDWSELIINASDNYYTILKKSVVSDDVDYSVPGTYLVTVKLEDGSSNFATQTFSVTVSDAPKVSNSRLAFYNTEKIDEQQLISMLGIKDGNSSADELSVDIQYNGLDLTNLTVGTYKIDIMVQDKDNNYSNAKVSVNITEPMGFLYSDRIDSVTGVENKKVSVEELFAFNPKRVDTGPDDTTVYTGHTDYENYEPDSISVDPNSLDDDGNTLGFQQATHIVADNVDYISLFRQINPYTKITAGDILYYEFYINVASYEGERQSLYLCANYGDNPWDYTYDNCMNYHAFEKVDTWYKVTGKMLIDQNIQKSRFFLSCTGYNNTSEFQVAGLKVYKLNKNDIPFYKVPYSENNYYAGMEEDADWRTEAFDSIKQNRMVEIEFDVIKDGLSLKEADITINQIDTPQSFGNVICFSCYEDRPEDYEIYQDLHFALSNETVVPNYLKWRINPYADINSTQIIDLHERAQQEGHTVRGHTIHWPKENHFAPIEIENKLNNDFGGFYSQEAKDYFTERSYERVTEALTNFEQFNIGEWDVVNELPDGTGIALPDENGNQLIDYSNIKHWFELYNQFDPSLIAVVNDYNIVSSMDSRDVQERLEKWKPLFDSFDEGDSARPDIFGFQGYFSCPVAIEVMSERARRIAKEYDVKWKMTETTFKFYDDKLVEDFIRDLIIMSFSDDSCEGLVMWGSFINFLGDNYNSDTPNTGVGFFNPDGTFSDVGASWVNTIYRDLWINNLHIDMDDTLQKLYYGAYEVVVCYNGIKYRTNIAVDENTKIIKLNLSNMEVVSNLYQTETRIERIDAQIKRYHNYLNLYK